VRRWSATLACPADGSDPAASRPPDASILAAAAAAGYPTVVGYDVDPRDYQDPGRDAVRSRVASGLRFEDDYSSPFMLMAYRVRPERRERIPAVTHADGTGRLQTVTRAVNPRFYDLIAAFGRLTGVPLLLNTSFNENEPIVCQPGEAVDCFLRTEMDVLVLGDWVVDRGTAR